MDKCSDHDMRKHEDKITTGEEVKELGVKMLEEYHHKCLNHDERSNAIERNASVFKTSEKVAWILV